MIATAIRLTGWVRGALRWMADHPDILLLAFLAAVCVVRGNALNDARQEIDRQRNIAAQWKGDFLAQRQEMRKFAGMVREAGVQAAKDDAANRKRVEQLWSTKLEQQSHEYQSSLAAAFAGVDRRLRGGSAEGGNSAAGGCGEAQLPRLSAMPEGALPAGGAGVISRADALICIGNTVRLEALIAAWNGAASIDVNGH
ncbi:hypothetical protein SAMN02927924_01383 [Sphingobium faniae]|nr:hypothetical protein SAMN02927924_01383 [Sphingobium faniae]